MKAIDINDFKVASRISISERSTTFLRLILIRLQPLLHQPQD